jgi:Protein of unknown function (DUF2752)
VEDDRRVEIRSKAAILLAGAAAAAAVLRFFPPGEYPIYPFCLWHTITGWRCPGCGTTRAVAALLAGRWSDAVHHNALAVAFAPVMGAMFSMQCYSGLRYNRWLPRAYELKLRISRYRNSRAS